MVHGGPWPSIAWPLDWRLCVQEEDDDNDSDNAAAAADDDDDNKYSRLLRERTPL